MLTNREFHLQTGNLAYKTGFSFTKRESWVTKGILGLLFTYSEEKEVEVKGLPLLIYRYEDGFVSAYYEYQESVFILSADKIYDDEIIKIIEGIN